MFALPKYGDTVSIDLGAGNFVGSVMHIDNDEIEITTDGGDTSQEIWLDDIIDITILESANG